MEKVVVYSDNFNGHFKVFLDDFVKEKPCELSYRSARFFRAEQREPLKSAVVDGDAKNSEFICDTLKGWGVEVTVSGREEATKKATKKADKKA